MYTTMVTNFFCAHPGVIFGICFLRCFATNKQKNTLRGADNVRHSSAYIILYLLIHAFKSAVELAASVFHYIAQK